MGSQSYCVDCNYEGPLTTDGDCARCGSEWTSFNAENKVTEHYSFLDHNRMPKGPIGIDGLAFDF